jgi:hypothetical protein
MTDLHMTWIRTIAETHSYRSMYALAAEIAGSDQASADVRRAARRVVRVLQDVIELPIADAFVLARARKRFAVLTKALSRFDEADAA